MRKFLVHCTNLSKMIQTQFPIVSESWGNLLCDQSHAPKTVRRKEVSPSLNTADTNRINPSHPHLLQRECVHQIPAGGVTVQFPAFARPSSIESETYASIDLRSIGRNCLSARQSRNGRAARH